MSEKRVYNRSYKGLEGFDGKYAADRPGCTRARAIAILKGGKLVAKVVASYPADGAGRLYADLFDWTDRDGGIVVWHGTAGGYGYDKLAGALDGATLGGVELGTNWEHNLRDAGFEVVTLL